MKNLFVRMFTLVMLSIFVVSCGNAPSNVLSGVKVSTSTVNNDVMMTFQANLNLGAMSFASIALPIIDPKGQEQIGQLELTSDLSGSNLMKVSINMSRIVDINTTTALLPNGSTIPLIALNQTIAINVGNGAKIYFTLTENVTAIGVAVPISAFDSIGASLPGLNVFPVISTDGVVGTAGIFTGAKAGQNGIAVVADVSSLVNLGSLMPAQASSLAIQAEQSRDSLQLDYSSKAVSASKKSSLDNMIYKLNQKKAVLKIK